MHSRKRAHQFIEQLEGRTLLSGFATVDNLSIAGGFPFAMTSDSAGDVFAAGNIDVGSGKNLVDDGVVREMAAGSSTWTTIEQYAYTDGKGANVRGLATDAAGDLFVAGGSTSGHWIVLERFAGHSTFSLIDDVGSSSKTSTTTGMAWGMSVDAAGDLFVAGQVSTSTTSHNGTTTINDWTVRELAAGRSAFTTVDSFAGASNRADSVTSISSGANAGIYVAGMLTGTSTSVWGVRKSTDGGTTWTTVDQTSFQAFAMSAAADAAGNLYVVGPGETSDTFYHWLVRESSNGGVSWTTVDDFLLSRAAEATSVSIDSAGNAFVTGFAADSSNADHSIVRTNAGGTWHTIDDYQLAAGKNTSAEAGTIDSSGNFYTANMGIDAGGDFHWLVRELSAFSASITTPTQANGTYSTTISFNRAASGFDLSDLSLATPAGVIAGSDFATYGASITSTDGINYVLALPATLTGALGQYAIALAAIGSGIADANGLPLLAGTTVAWSE